MFNNRCGRQNFMTMPSQNGLIDIQNNKENIDIDLNSSHYVSLNLLLEKQ